VEAGAREPLSGVSETALGAAEMRAHESSRTDRIINDPYAASFVAAAPPLFADIPSLVDEGELAALVAAGVDSVAIRTRFVDDFLSRACAAGCHQVVLLAAGLDTRAFRLNWPEDVRLYELDLPELFGFKERILAEEGAVARCERRVVEVDLREDWPSRLARVGFEPAIPSAWVAEGLLVYLSSEDAARVLTSVGELAAPGSQLSLDYEVSRDGSSQTGTRSIAGMREVTSMWQGGLGSAVPKWLSDHGWRVRTHDGASLAQEYGRPRGAGDAMSFLTATCGG
jgi:methyltransferase (TIGR00027 family)